MVALGVLFCGGITIAAIVAAAYFYFKERE